MNIVKFVEGERVNVEPNRARATVEELNTLFDSGCTVQFFQPQRHVDALWQVNSLLENYFGNLAGTTMITVSQSPAVDDKLVSSHQVRAPT